MYSTVMLRNPNEHALVFFHLLSEPLINTSVLFLYVSDIITSGPHIAKTTDNNTQHS